MGEFLLLGAKGLKGFFVILRYVHARSTRNIMYIICQLAHSANIAHALAVQLGTPIAADVIQTSRVRCTLMMKFMHYHLSFEDKSNWLRSNAVTAG